MAGNVQCPVCTLFLLPGMDLSDHLETHPKEQVIKALVQMSLKSEVTETVTPDTPKKVSSTPSIVNEVHHRTNEDERATPMSVVSESTVGVNEKQRELEDNNNLAPIPQSISLNRQCGYLFENNSSSSSSSSSSNFFGPPTPYYHQHHQHHQHQQQQQQQLQQQQQQQQQQQSQQQQQQQHHLQNYHSYNGHPGQAQPPMRLFSYQPNPKPLQPPPAYGAAISQLRSQNSQNLMVSHINRPQYSPGNHSSISSPSTSSLSVVSSRLPPPLPPPPLNMRFQSSFPQMETPPFTDTCDSNVMSPRRSSTTPPIRPPPQLYRSPLLSAGQYSRQSSSPYSVMTGSPSVLRFAESPVTAHYLERENGDFIVQETPKHVVECVEKDDGEFSVIERVYHMPPSVVQINEDQDDDLSSDHGSNSEDMKLMEDDLPGGTWSGARSPEQGQTASQKKSGITVLSDVQLDLNEYLDLMGNIIASSKVAKSRTEMIKIEKFEPEEVKEEMSGTICLDNDDEDNENEIAMENEQKLEETKEEQQQYNDESSCYPAPLAMAGSSGCVTPASSMTSVIRLATNPSARSNTPSAIIMQVDDKNTKVEDAAPSTSIDIQLTKVEDSVTSPDAVPMEAANDSTTNVEEATSTDTPVAKVEEAIDLQSQTTTEKPQIPEKPPKHEKQSKKEGKSPVLSYYQSVRRPIKKTPKKLVIKPRSKDTAASAPSQMQTEQPSTSKETPSVEHRKEEVLAKVGETTQENELNSIKTESLTVTTSDSIPPPLFADADEKLPPDDELMPCTSHSIATEEDAASAAFSNSTLEDKPTADLTAFLDQCMKKEEETEDHPMHSIFGAECVSEEPETLNEAIPSPASPPIFPSASLFSKPLTASPEQLTASDSVLLDSSDVHEHDPPPPQQKQTQQQAPSSYVEYPFSFLYGAEANHQDENKHNISPPIYCSEDFNKYSASTSGGNSASCTWYQSQSSENDFEMDGKGSYLDLDSCKRSASFAAATEGSMPTTDTLNIRTDEKMPAKGEISEQESNCGVENSWSQPLYNEFPVRFPIPYQNFMTTQESWSHDNYFRPQDLSSSVETKNFSLRLTEESPIMDTLPSTSKRKNKSVAKLPRKKTFQCAHCNTHFPLLKEKNAHLIKQHGYKRVNRRLIRDPPTSTVTTATMNTDAGAALLLGLEPSVLPPPLAEEDDSKAAIVKIEQENKELKDCKKTISNLALTSNTVTTAANANVSRTKYDSMRARDNRMLINFNLNALNVKNEGKTEVETHSFYQESKSAFFCFVCRRDFLTVKLFDEHLVEHPAECFTCHKTFTRWKNFMVHLKRHLGWKDFGCTICEKKFVIRSALVEHMRMHTGHTPLKCKICGKSFKRYSNLTQHRKRHGNRINRTKEYVCYCGEVLPSKARFIWHKETHDLKPKCCPYCRDRFVHANSLRRHIRLAHSDKFDYTEPMECPMCKQIYAKSSIKAHMATHSMDTQHECLICNKSFSTKWNLKIHNWVHANRTTKPFKCDQCVKAFVREVDYNNHMNSHKQIKPYTCEHCGCKFIRKYNYIRHRREHHGNKKFTCDLCGKLFHRHYYLIEHRRIHTGERPFQCTICGKSSTTKTNHNKHLKIHHSRDPFTSEA